MTTKVEPTVEKWKSEFDEKFGKVKVMSDNPKEEIPGAYLHLGDKDYYVVEGSEAIKDFIRHSVQEAKAERDREWIKELKPTGIGNSLYIMPSNHLFDSIKQEEEL